MSQTETGTASGITQIQLTPPEPVPPVPAKQAEGAVKLEPAEMADLNAKIEAFVSEIVATPANTEAFQDKVNRVHQLGNADIRAAASISNRLLQRPMHALDTLDQTSPVGKALIDLRQQIDDLNPKNYGDLLSPKKLFGIIPAGDKLRDYFDTYRSAQSHLNSIIQSLLDGQDELMKDNAAIEEEKRNAWALMKKLEQYVQLGKGLDSALDARLAAIKAQDAQKAKAVREEMQFYVRQKVQDLLTQLAVTMQGYLAIDMIRKNNLELIKGVDRATTTTVSALRTAVLVAQALANQKLVLDQVNALNKTTGSLIEHTAEQLKAQGAATHEQAASAAVSVETLQRSFANIYEAMDALDNYKIRALDTMKKTVEMLSGEVEKAKTYLDRTRAQDARAAIGGGAGEVAI
jgi:uncharacterized protein YaaN involved in tellurite resistance